MNVNRKKLSPVMLDALRQVKSWSSGRTGVRASTVRALLARKFVRRVSYWVPINDTVALVVEPDYVVTEAGRRAIEEANES